MKGEIIFIYFRNLYADLWYSFIKIPEGKSDITAYYIKLQLCDFSMQIFI